MSGAGHTGGWRDSRTEWSRSETSRPATTNNMSYLSHGFIRRTEHQDKSEKESQPPVVYIISQTVDLVTTKGARISGVAHLVDAGHVDVVVGAGEVALHAPLQLLHVLTPPAAPGPRDLEAVGKHEKYFSGQVFHHRTVK